MLACISWCLRCVCVCISELSVWTSAQVCQWLSDLDLGEHCDTFMSHDIRGHDLLTLARSDLKVPSIVTSDDEIWPQTTTSVSAYKLSYHGQTVRRLCTPMFCAVLPSGDWLQCIGRIFRRLATALPVIATDDGDVCSSGFDNFFSPCFCRRSVWCNIFQMLIHSVLCLTALSY